jgi:hypothetical protein
VEIDLGHTSAAEFALKLEIHARYARGGLFRQRYGADKAATLVVTTGSQRRDNLRAIAEGQRNARVWFSTFAEVAAGGVLGAVWHAPFAERLLRLQPSHTDGSPGAAEAAAPLKGERI